MHKFDQRDLLAGVLLFVIGGAFLVGSLGMRIGTARSMGAGYFPLIASSITLVLGLVIAGLALRRAAGEIERPDLRPFLAVTASVGTFAVALGSLGLLPAIMATVLVAALADRRSTPLSALVLAAVLAMASWLIFIVGLGMPIPLLKSPL